tara:strand:+ start:173 stop:376 length:204 start_codon:yes stop_codon:yes gene_type:complete
MSKALILLIILTTAVCIQKTTGFYETPYYVLVLYTLVNGIWSLFDLSKNTVAFRPNGIKLKGVLRKK